MPEGHTIHRHARLQTKALSGGPVRVTSPQGWASVAAAELDGRELERIDAYGKHLLYRFEGAPALHVHLGLFGKYRTHKVPAPEPWGAVRLRFEAAERVVDLSGATASELIDPITEEELLARLGPDPLRGDDPEPAWEALKRRRIPISALLLDQRFVAGIGNVYRAEMLFACGIDPFLASNTLKRSEFDELWETGVAMLKVGERSGRIVTVPASEAGGAPSKLKGRDRVQVYRRESCRRCGSPIRTKEVAARTLYWCPQCQPRKRRKAR